MVQLTAARMRAAGLPTAYMATELFTLVLFRHMPEAIQLRAIYLEFETTPYLSVDSVLLQYFLNGDNVVVISDYKLLMEALINMNAFLGAFYNWPDPPLCGGLRHRAGVPRAGVHA